MAPPSSFDDHGVPGVEPPALPLLPLMEIDRRIARFVWLERRRFEVLGGWTASVPELDVKAMVATQSHHHAWHASLWQRHLPHRSGEVMSDGARSFPDRLGAFVDALRSSEDTLDRLVGAYRVLGAHAVAAYSRLLDGATAVPDAALARTCRLVLADQLDDWRRGEMALQCLLGSGADVERAGARQAHLEALLLDEGGFDGVGAAGRGV